MKEIWKSIYKGYYEVSNLGRVRRIKPGSPNTYVGKILKVHNKKDSYVKVQLYRIVDGKRYRKPYEVHVLVAKKFIGPCHVGKEVNHKDLDKSNNRVDNLEYVTSKGNKEHAVRHGVCYGRDQHGERNAAAKLDFNTVSKIRKLYGSGNYSQPKLAKKFNVTQPTVCYIVNNKTWEEGGR